MRSPLDVVVRQRSGSAASGAKLYVYLRGTKTAATGYTTEGGEKEVSYPLVSDEEGRVSNAWYEPGSYDLYLPEDTLNPTQPWEAAGLPKSIFNVGAYGAKLDGVTDDTAAIEAALAAAAVAGGVVFFPAGVTLCSKTLIIDNNVTIMGAGKEASTIKLKGGANVPLLKTARYGAGGATGGATGFALRHIGFDGNKANNATLAAPLVDLDGLSYLIEDMLVQNGNNVNLRAKLSRETPLYNLEVQVRGLYLFNAGAANLKWEGPTDAVLSGVIARRDGAGANIEAGSTTNKWIGCHAYGNSDYSWVIGNGVFIDCAAEGGKLAQVKLTGSGVVWKDGRVFYGGGEDGRIGFLFGTVAFSAQIDTEIENCNNGAFKFEAGGGAGSILAGFVFGSEAKPALVGTIPAEIDLFDLYVKPPMTLGTTLGERTRGGLTLTTGGDITSETGRLSLTEREAAPSQTANAGKVYTIDDGAGKTDLRVRFGTGTDVVLGKEGSAPQEVASANTITVKDAGPATVVKVTGSTEIKKITATRPNHLLTLIFTGTLFIANGENLKLASSVRATPGFTITLICDGTNWEEVSRKPAASAVEVASANTITIPGDAMVATITGVTEVKSINATYNGHIVVLRWASTAKLVQGENLKIPATLSPTEHDSCIIHCDGTNWYQSSPLQANP